MMNELSRYISDIPRPHEYHDPCLQRMFGKIRKDLLLMNYRNMAMSRFQNLLIDKIDIHPIGISFPRTVDIRKDNFFSIIKGVAKITVKIFGAAKTMRLKNHSNIFPGLMECPQHSLHLGGMVPVVVDDGEAAAGMADVKAAFGAAETAQRALDGFKGDADAGGQGDGREGVGDVVFARDAKDDIAKAEDDLKTQAGMGGDAAELATRYPKAQSRDYDGDPARLTEMDALIAYLQVLGTMVNVDDAAAQEQLAKEQGR